MNIQQFRYILAVVDSKNFESAAEKCFVAQSTLSTMIGRLEDEMGVKIFNRNTKPVSITTEGEQIINRLRIVLHEVDSLDNVVQELKGDMGGELRLGVIPTIAPYLLPLFLTDFSDKFPKVKIIVREMTTAQIQQSLKVRSIDIGILALPLNDGELEEVELYTEPFLIYDCTSKKCDVKMSINNLDYSKLFLLQEGHCLRTQVQHICELSNQCTESKASFEFESGSMDSLLRITKNRKGITVIPYLASIDFTKEEREKLVEFADPVPMRTLGLATHKFFVKKKLLGNLQGSIQQSISHLMPRVENSKVLRPF